MAEEMTPSPGAVLVLPQRRAVHIASETLALLAAAPFLIWASYQTPVALARVGLRLLAGVTVIVDGLLLERWLRDGARENDMARFADALRRRR